MQTIRELSQVEEDMIAGGPDLPSVPWYVRAAGAISPGIAVGVLAYDLVKLGWDSAHGRAENADS